MIFPSRPSFFGAAKGAGSGILVVNMALFTRQTEGFVWFYGYKSYYIICAIYRLYMHYIYIYTHCMYIYIYIYTIYIHTVYIYTYIIIYISAKLWRYYISTLVKYRYMFFFPTCQSCFVEKGIYREMLYTFNGITYKS